MVKSCGNGLIFVKFCFVKTKNITKFYIDAGYMVHLMSFFYFTLHLGNLNCNLRITKCVVILEFSYRKC
jgi:hypothetical protein